MKTRSTIYFNDEKIYLKNEKTKKIIIEKINNNIIKNGKINNIEKFIKMYENLIKKYKLNNNIFGETIKIIVNPTTKPEKEKSNTGTNIAAPNFWKLALKSILANIFYPPDFKFRNSVLHFRIPS